MSISTLHPDCKPPPVEGRAVPPLWLHFLPQHLVCNLRPNVYDHLLSECTSLPFNAANFYATLFARVASSKIWMGPRRVSRFIRRDFVITNSCREKTVIGEKPLSMAWVSFFSGVMEMFFMEIGWMHQIKCHCSVSEWGFDLRDTQTKEIINLNIIDNCSIVILHIKNMPSNYLLSMKCAFISWWKSLKPIVMDA